MNRKKDQAELLFQFGTLLGPVLKLAEHPESYDGEERTRILARFWGEKDRFEQAVRRFVAGEPGHFYYEALISILDSLPGPVQLSRRPSNSEFLHAITECRDKVMDGICSIPIPVEATIHEAGTPFSTYCIIKDLCSTVKTELVWMDRYFDQALFHRYFADTPSTARVTLVTWPETKCQSAADRRRYDEFMNVSRLFAQERGPERYRLITDEQFHDRWLRCDDKLFALGGSVKDLRNDVTFTISKLD